MFVWCGLKNAHGSLSTEGEVAEADISMGEVGKTLREVIDDFMHVFSLPDRIRSD